jgi:hypothetical protein
MDHVVSMLRLLALHNVDNHLTERPTTLRFAVATFDTGTDLRNALQSLRSDGLSDDTFNFLSLEEALADATLHTLVAGAAGRLLYFPGQHRPISCTAGPLADRLVDRLLADAPTLKAALGHWLIPRHAQQVQDAVEQGKIVLWVRLLDSKDEPLAYRSLLACSSHSVGVHDLVVE